MKKIYGEIAKTEELDDGTVKVWGYASSAAVDADGETITSEAMKAALPDYMKFGAVREMHKNDAAGTAIEASVQDDGRTFFGAHVVDPVAVKKVRAGVYKGFSIGGRVTMRDDLNKTIITGINLVEVSLVDRPANPAAVFTMYKADTLEEASVDPGEPDDASKVSAVDALADYLNKGTITPEALVEFIKSKEVVVESDPVEAPAVAKSDEPTPEETVVVEAEPVEVAPADEVQKGLYNVQDFANVLRNLSYVCSEAEWDKQTEGDSSPVPAQLRAWLTQGAAIFQTMAAEELAELIAGLNEEAGEHANAVAMAAATDGLTKVQAAADDLQKRFDEQTEAYTKAVEAVDAFGKAFGLLEGEDLITKAQGILAERDELLDLKKSWEDAPAKAKAILKVLSKGEDFVLSTPTQEPDPVKKADGKVNEAATAIKKLHSSGGQPFMA